MKNQLILVIILIAALFLVSSCNKENPVATKTQKQNNCLNSLNANLELCKQTLDSCKSSCTTLGDECSKICDNNYFRCRSNLISENEKCLNS